MSRGELCTPLSRAFFSWLVALGGVWSWQGLSRHAVASFDEVRALLDEGNKIRILACTNRNAQSSRSHTVFSMHVTQVRR